MIADYSRTSLRGEPMLLAKQGIFLQMKWKKCIIFSISEVVMAQNTYNTICEVYLHFYMLKLFCFVQNLTIWWINVKGWSVLNTSLGVKIIGEKCN